MDHPFSSHLKNRTWQDIFRETAPCCLRAEDRQCTAVGLERYDPFFDHRVVELMFRVPGTAKIRDGATKILLARRDAWPAARGNADAGQEDRLECPRPRLVHWSGAHDGARPGGVADLPPARDLTSRPRWIG